MSLIRKHGAVLQAWACLERQRTTQQIQQCWNNDTNSNYKNSASWKSDPLDKNFPVL